MKEYLFWNDEILIESINADIICFGHTHRPYYKVNNKITMINPGSICYPRGHYKSPTYCIFDTKNRKTTFYNTNTLLPCDPFDTSYKKESF